MSDNQEFTPIMVSLPVEVMNKIMSVLASLPYGQVAPLVAEIQKTAVTNNKE